MIRLVGHYNRLHNNRGINEAMSKRGYTKEQMDALRGRIADTGSNIVESCDIKFLRGVDDYEYPHFNFVIEMFDKYDASGILPFEGCHADQPSQIIEIFQVLSQLKYEHEKRLRKEQEREQKKLVKGNNIGKR